MKFLRVLLPFGLIFCLLLSGCKPTAPTTPIPFSAWSDRSLFSSGLIKSKQDALSLPSLAGASVYHIDVTISDSLTTLTGTEEVRYTNQESHALNEIYFRLFPNFAGGSTLVSEVTQDGKAVKTSLMAKDTSLRVALNTPLRPQNYTVIHMNFLVQIPAQFGGTYGLFGYVDDVLLLDGFYPAVPVNDQNGWHSLAPVPNADTTFQDASFYEVRVAAPADLTLVTSGVQVDRVLDGDRQTATFAAGPARDFYIAASSHFDVISKTIGETLVNSYYAAEDVKSYQLAQNTVVNTLKGSSPRFVLLSDNASAPHAEASSTGTPSGAQLALETAVNALRDYSVRFGDYPYTEFDVVAGPLQGASGIEYPGITIINQGLYQQVDNGGMNSYTILEATVAHETGHQWFYNIVGNDQTNDPWLDESVTQYITALYYYDQYGRAGYQGYRDSWVSRWDRVQEEEIPVGLPAGSYTGKQYGAIIYGRGPLFLEALAQQMGQSTFDLFLRDYYQANEWGIGYSDSFETSAEEHCQCDLTALFEQWLLQQ